VRGRAAAPAEAQRGTSPEPPPDEGATGGGS